MTRDAYFTPIVQVTVGNGAGAKTFNIYKGVLVHYSDYFRNALKGCWKEGQDNIIELPDDDPEVFRVFQYWLFSRRLYHEETTLADKQDVEEVPLSYGHIVNIFLFADRRGIKELANEALDSLRAKVCQKWEHSADYFQTIYENTLKGSPLRRFVVDYLIVGRAFNNFGNEEEYVRKFPHEMLVDLIQASHDNRFCLMGCTGKHSQSLYTSTTAKHFCELYHDHSGINGKTNFGS